MLRGAPLRGMKALRENESFGSHADRVFPGGVGFWLSGKMPTVAATAVVNTLTVATSDIFIGCGELE